MNNSINSQSDNLADIVGMGVFADSTFITPTHFIVGALIVITLLLLLSYHIIHSDQTQLRKIKYQLIHTQLTPREAAHNIALLSLKKPLNSTLLKQLNALRFSAKAPSQQQMLEFIRHAN